MGSCVLQLWMHVFMTLNEWSQIIHAHTARHVTITGICNGSTEIKLITTGNKINLIIKNKTLICRPILYIYSLILHFKKKSDLPEFGVMSANIFWAILGNLVRHNCVKKKLVLLNNSIQPSKYFRWLWHILLLTI